MNKALSHGGAKALVLLTVLLFLAPPILRGEVVFAHDNAVEVGMRPPKDEHPSNRKFSDQSSVFLPELHHHLNGDRAGWISTWNPHVELGRPSTHVSGFSKAYFLTHVLSFLSRDAFHVYTWLVAAAVALTALFGYLLLEALGLRPAACLAGALGLALGVFAAYWLTFVLFIWSICWTLALLWTTVLFWRRPALLSFAGLAVSVHALLLSGYPQQIVWHGYVAIGFVLLLVRATDLSWGSRLARLGGLAGAVLLGVASVAPVYLDLASQALRSTRLEAPASFFLAVLPRMESWRDLLFVFTQLFDAFWIGNPIGSAYPRSFNGVSLAPLLGTLWFVSLADWRRLWPVQAFVAAAFVANVWAPAYEFGIEHALLNVSRFNPLAGALIPIVVLCAVAADRLLGREIRPRAALFLGALPAALAVTGLLVSPHDPHVGHLLLGGLVFLATSWFLVRPSSWLLAALAVSTALVFGAPLRLIRPRDSIQTSSPLVELVAEETRGGERYAWVQKARSVALTPNQEALLGLRSIHTYNSLSSKEYQSWVTRLSEHGAVVHGRYFFTITTARKVFGPDLPLAGVGLLISELPLPPSRAEEIAEGVYRPLERPILQALFEGFERTGTGVSVLGHQSSARAAARVEDRDDLLVVDFPPARKEALLFVSQEHHPRWEARSGGEQLETVLVDGFYQGVLVPAGTEQVELRFRPLAPSILYSQIGLLVLLLVGIVGAARRSPDPDDAGTG